MAAKTSQLKLVHRVLLMVAVPLVFQCLFVVVLESAWQQTRAARRTSDRTARLLAVGHRTLSSIRQLQMMRRLQTYPSQQMDQLNLRIRSDLRELSSLVSVGKPFRPEKEQFHSALALLRPSGIADGAIDNIETSLADLLAKVETRLMKNFTDDSGMSLGNRSDYILWEQQVHHFLAFGFTINLLICILLVFHFSQNVSKRLHTIMSNSDRFAQEKELLPPVEGNDEISELDRMFRVMTDSIERARKRERQFLGMVSHDLRTPLNTILATLNSLESGLYGSLSETGVKRVQQSEKAIENLSRLTNDLLDVEKLSSGTIVLQLQPTPLMKVLDTAIADLNGFADFKTVGITIEGRVDVNVMADEQRLLQLFENLLSNAIKFSPEKSEVRIKILERDRPFIEVQVIDSGCGIATRDQQSIFEPFVQVVDESGSRAQGGSGLGLAICRSIIEAHGGKISVQSELAKGATFKVRLRCAANAVANRN